MNVLDVSVVIPTYNREKLIIRTLESLRNQNSWPSAVIMVDDCSTDRTCQVARDWAHRHGFPLEVLESSVNGGPAVARNLGITSARSRYIAFLDSDDEHLPNTLEMLVSALDAHDDAVLSFGDATVVTPSGDIPHGLFAPRVKLGLAADVLPDGLYRLRNATTTLLAASIIPTSATCFRRESAMAVGMMPPDFRSGEDWLFFLRLSQQGGYIFYTADLALHHRHDDNLTSPHAGEFMAREKLRGLLGLFGGQLGIRLDMEQQSRVAAMLADQQAIWRYHLSTLGVKPYWRGLRSMLGEASGGWVRHLSADPKSLARAVWYSLGGRA